MTNAEEDDPCRVINLLRTLNIYRALAVCYRYRSPAVHTRSPVILVETSTKPHWTHRIMRHREAERWAPGRGANGQEGNFHLDSQMLEPPRDPPSSATDI